MTSILDTAELVYIENNCMSKDEIKEALSECNHRTLWLLIFRLCCKSGRNRYLRCDHNNQDIRYLELVRLVVEEANKRGSDIPELVRKYSEQKW